MKSGPIGVAGAGAMGSGIAQVVAQAGKPVLLLDQSPALVEKAIGGLRGGLAKRVEQGKLDKAAFEATMGNIKAASGIADLRQCALIIEAVFENVDVKKKFYTELSPAVPADTLVYSNTSTIPITRLGAAVKHPERFGGMHFFNPPQAMRLVEVIKGLTTAQATIDEGVAFVKAIGKTAIVCGDSPGFAVNRLAVPMLNEAAFLLGEGIATKEDIDTGVKLGLNHPMGPFELMDLLGVEVVYSVICILYEETGDSKYRPAPILRRMVEAGHFGRKTGKGFYEYGRK
ncbi:MAG: 3-hydroxybutyryl-CoA dehydrogenase [Chloroflexi bacterium]|nr:3-hydroxybutyryl-CoA dehydrogenase [Chloroflexota bacterium]